MEKFMDENSSMYRKERDSFLDSLRRFHLGRGTHLRQLPTLGGREVDLFHLYRVVTVRGGWEKVNEEQKWEDVAEDLHLPVACVNVAQALRYIYIRYLELYEKVHFFGEDPDLKRTDGQEEVPGQRKKLNYASSVPMAYNHSQHKLSDYMRQTLNLPMPQEPCIYRKIEQSLTSGLPNEVDFAMNICTLLSSEGKHTLNLERAPQLIYLMLGHIGVFDTGPGSLKQVHLEAWKPASGHNFLRFWWESIEDTGIRKLICPEVRPGNTAVVRIDEHDPLMSTVLNTKRDSGMYDKEGQRVVQVAMVLRNLSFEVENMKVLASNDVVLRYIILAAHCSYHSVRQLALDTLGNIGLQMVLSPLDPYLKCVIFTILKRCLLSEDKFEVVTGLELLARLCQVPTNEDVLCDALDGSIYARIVSYLTVHDIQLIAYTLECLYQLSELGEVTATHIARVSRAVTTLVSLVTVEAQSYGPESIKGIRVVEHIPAGVASAVPAPQPVENLTRPTTSKGVTPQKPPISQAMRRPPAVPTPPTQVRVPSTATPPPHSVVIPEGGRGLASRWLQSFYEVDINSQVNKMEVYANYLQALSKMGHTQVPDMREMIIALRLTFPRVEIVKLEKDNGSTPVVLVKGIRPRENPLPLEQNPPPGGRFPPPRVPTPSQNVGHTLPRPGTPQSGLPAKPRPSTPQNTSQQMAPQRHSFTPPPQFLAQPSTSIPVSFIQGPVQPTPPHSPSNQQSMLQQALLKSSGPSNSTTEGSIATPPSPSPTPPPNQVQTKPVDQNLIKSLLANKLQQNMQRYNEVQERPPHAQVTHSAGVQQGTFAPPAQNGPQVTHANTVGNSSNEMAPPRVPCVPSNPSSAFENEFQHFMQTQNEIPAVPQVVTKKTRKKSTTSPPKGRVKKSKTCEERVESAIDSQSQTVCDSVKGASNSADLLKGSVESAQDAFQNEVKGQNIDAEMKSNSAVSMISQLSCDQKQSDSNTPSVDIKTHEVPCDVKQNSHKSDSMLQLNSQTANSKCENGSQDPVFNGVLPAHSPKEISPNKLNTSIEQKKARIAQLMKDTKILKEQLKGINGVAIADEVKPSDDVLTGSDNPSLNSAGSNVNESQGTKINCSKSEKLHPGSMPSGLHCQVNGFPEAVNGSHTGGKSVGETPSNLEPSDVTDLSSDLNGPVSSQAPIVDTQGLTIDDLNRNNNCNGEGDSAPPSPASVSSSHPGASSTDIPSSVQSSPQCSQSAETSSTQSEQTEDSPISTVGVFTAPPLPPSGHFVQPSQVPGPISTPKAIMSAVPQSTSFSQNVTPQSTLQGQTVPPASHINPGAVAQMPQANTQLLVSSSVSQASQPSASQPATAKQLSLHEIVAQANQIVAQPQMVAQGGQIIQQQPQMVTQGGQIISQQIPVPVQNASQPQFISQPQAAVSVPHQMPQVVQGQIIQQTGQALVQQVQGQLLNQANQVVSQQGIISQAAAQSQVVTQAQVMNPQGQIIQQGLPGHVVQQLLQQAQLAQQATATQSQVIVQQAPQVTQQGAVIVQQAQSQIVPQVIPGQVLLQTPAQASSQGTVALATQGAQMVQNQLSLHVGQVVQQQLLVPQAQQVVQRPVLMQPTPNRPILPQPQMTVQTSVAAQVAQPNVGTAQHISSVRYIPQPVASAQIPIQVSTTTTGQLASQTVGVLNQSQCSPAMQKMVPYPVVQQQLHSSNPSIVTPPPASPQSSRSSPGPLPSPGGTKPAKRPPSRHSDTGDKPKKKRRSQSKDKKGSSVPSSPSPSTTPVPSAMVVQYMCEWNGCHRCFEASKQLQKHVIQTHHASLDGVDGHCPWQGCDTLKRQRWSLITHIQDKHLNEAALRAAALRRHQQAASPAASPPATPSAPPPVYPVDAAMQAIKRFSVKPPYQEFMEMKEGPVTKHIRLTSALILRNLARYSAAGRKELKKHEHQLAYVALSPVESSAAISSCLLELQKA